VWTLSSLSVVVKLPINSTFSSTEVGVSPISVGALFAALTVISTCTVLEEAMPSEIRYVKCVDPVQSVGGV